MKNKMKSEKGNFLEDKLNSVRSKLRAFIIFEMLCKSNYDKEYTSQQIITSKHYSTHNRMFRDETKTPLWTFS